MRPLSAPTRMPRTACAPIQIVTVAIDHAPSQPLPPSLIASPRPIRNTARFIGGNVFEQFNAVGRFRRRVINTGVIHTVHRTITGSPGWENHQYVNGTNIQTTI